MARPIQLTAAQRVLEIQKLLEEILHHVDLPDLVRALHLTRRFRDTVLTETNLKHRLDHALWREPVPRDTWLYFVGCSYTGRDGRLTYHPNFLPTSPECPISGGTVVGRVHSLMLLRFQPSNYDYKDTRCCFQWSSLQSFPVEHLDDFLTQPPCTHTSILAIRELNFVERGDSLCQLDGMRFRDLIEHMKSICLIEIERMRLLR